MLLDSVLEFQVLLPLTKPGEAWSVSLPPSPNGPLESAPQHFMSLLSRIAQVWEPPADTATAVRLLPRSIGVDEGASVLLLLPPSHNCP